MSATTIETSTEATAVAATGPAAAKPSFLPLIMDVAVPLASYYLLKNGFGMSTVAALAWSSVVPAVRTLWSLVKERTFNGLAGLILLVNVVGLLLSLVAGDPRLMLAKDSGVGSVVGIGILLSVRLGRPMMTQGMKPFLIKGDAAKNAAWERLLAGSERFRQAERTFSLIWGAALLGECVLRVVGAYTLPVDTMVWLGTVVMVATIGLAILLSGRFAVVPMEKLLEQELAGRTR
ncbi:VC0807 family protein [Streptomyces sp. Tue6028]|uniref:VC0807 family protein n=1 Tax=Streptomyces sp. Tue6028 TaxID=2036037 RepID=UPI0015CCA761|nr:VC0807 family protein [Streptomyces sp. Tue6028]